MISLQIQFTAQADQLEKIDQETAKAIYEECRKIAEMVDMPLSHKTPTRRMSFNMNMLPDFVDK